jgi:hypothetical protein
MTDEVAPSQPYEIMPRRRRANECHIANLGQHAVKVIFILQV